MSDEEIILVVELENMRRKTLPNLSESEWFAIFPEAADLIPEKIQEWSGRHKELELLIREKDSLIKKESHSEFEYWFGREWLKLTLLSEMLEVEKHIRRLKNLLPKNQSDFVTTKLDESTIDRARSIPIIDIAMQGLQLTKHGKNYFAKCPFHEDKSPSFCIYPESNRFVCFGCNEKGDVITYTMKINNLNFKEAVLWLSERY